MPLIEVRTNASWSPEECKQVSLELTSKLSKLTGKAADYFMIDVEPGLNLMFANSTDPAASVSVSIIGDPGQKGNDEIAKTVAEVFAPRGVSAERTFVKVQVFAPTHWAMGGETLARA